MMLRLRIAVALVVGVLVLGTSAAGAQAPPEGVPPLTVTGSPVEPGGTIVVSGEGCRGGSAVMVGVLDALAEGVLVSGAVMPGEEGAWSSTLLIPPNTGPGVYPVTARCTDYSGYDGDGGGYSGYSGYDGYDGYNGSGSFDYVRGTVTVLPPTAAPSPQGDLTVTPNVIPVGGRATVTGSGWRADEQITLAMYSSPVVLGELRSGPDGSIEAGITVPLGTSLGTHTVCAMNATAALNPVRNLCAPITVVAASAPVEVTPVPVAVAGDTTTRGGALAFTGLHPWQLVLVGLILLALGAELYRRTRRTSSAD